MKIIVVTGPTASGKTDVALRLADRFPVRLISIDSAMVYRQMDIGTAKPDAETLERYPHGLVDIRDPADSYAVSDFVDDADAEVRKAVAAGQIPVLVGGTMMYLRAFRDGLDAVPRSTPEVRQQIAERAGKEGWERLHAELQRVDPRAAELIHPNNPQRLSRALEVYAMTGEPISAFWGQAEGAAERLGLPVEEYLVDVSDRALLHARIAERLEQMLCQGFVDEVRALKNRHDLHLDLPSMRAVGYRQVWQYLDGEGDEATMRERILAATRGLARRQYTWLRRWPHIERLAGESSEVRADRLADLAFG